MFFGYINLLRGPAFTQPNYHSSPTVQSQISPLAARALASWFLLSGILRLGAWWSWGQAERGFRGWYDAALVSIALPLWHYGLEVFVFGTVPLWGRQVAISGTVDGLGALWMVVARRAVVGR
jgi:hypothetical protein